jgi:hypothetical protein
LATFLLKEQDSLTPPDSVAKSATAKTTWRCAATSWHLAAVIAIAAFAEDFLHMVCTNMFPHILWKQTRPILSSGLLQEA